MVVFIPRVLHFLLFGVRTLGSDLKINEQINKNTLKRQRSNVARYIGGNKVCDAVRVLVVLVVAGPEIAFGSPYGSREHYYVPASDRYHSTHTP